MTFSPAQYAAITVSSLKKIPESVLWLNNEGRLVYVSDHISIQLGYNQDELQQKNIQDIDPTFSVEHYFSFLNNGESSCEVVESVFRCRSGE
jgi:PAS domain S-box-containing protein